MGLFDSGTDSDLVKVEKFDLALNNKLLRIIDWEAQVVIYTDTSYDSYTSIPLSETDINIEDAPAEIRNEAENESTE